MTLESSKTLGGVGAILAAVGNFVPFLGLIGIILVLIALKGLAEVYNERGIFQNALYAFIFGLIGIAAAIVLFLSMFATGFFMGMTPTPPTPPTETPLPSFIVSIIGVLIVIFIFYVLEAVFYRKSFTLVAEKSGEKMFNTAGTLLLIGAILVIIFIGAIIMLIAWILVAIAFFSIKTPPPSAEAPPPPPP